MEQGKSKQIKLGIGITIAITAIVGFFLYYKIKNKNKQSQEKQKVEVEQEPESQEEEIEEKENEPQKSEQKEKQQSPQKESIQESQKIEAFAQSWVEVDKSVQKEKEKVDLSQESQNQTKQTEKSVTQEVKPQEENKQSEKPQTEKSVQKTPQKNEKQSSKTPSKQPPKIIPKIKKVFPQKLQELRKNSREKRKTFYNKDWESYKKVVQEYLIQSQMLDDQILSETLKQFQVTQTEFDNAIDAYVQDEEVKQMVKTVFAASMISEVNIPQELNENELEKILNFQVTKLQELAQDAKKWGDMNVLLFIVQDQVEQQFGYKEEEVNMALKNFTEMNPQRFQHFYERMETINTMFMMYGKEQSSQLLKFKLLIMLKQTNFKLNTQSTSNILNHSQHNLEDLYQLLLNFQH